jgi:hypothetical protein
VINKASNIIKKAPSDGPTALLIFALNIPRMPQLTIEVAEMSKGKKFSISIFCFVYIAPAESNGVFRNAV